MSASGQDGAENDAQRLTLTISEGPREAEIVTANFRLAAGGRIVDHVSMAVIVAPEQVEGCVEEKPEPEPQDVAEAPPEDEPAKGAEEPAETDPSETDPSEADPSGQA